MLLLDRKLGESVEITVAGVTIRILVSKLSEKRVKLGFDAPSDVTIDRTEVHKSKLRERLDSLSSEKGDSEDGV